tara:strand:- start:2187 stop:2642 length:456 start_codon:yes stop_codon:yes gene_type:complete
MSVQSNNECITTSNVADDNTTGDKKDTECKETKKNSVEYKAEQHEKHLKRMRIYRANNKAKLAEYKREYYAKNTEHLREKNKEYQKTYWEKHPEKLEERRKQRAEKRLINTPQEVIDKKLRKAQKELEFLNQKVNALNYVKEIKTNSVQVC